MGGVGAGRVASIWTAPAGRTGGGAVPAPPEGSHRHHRQHAGRADAVRRLARNDAPGAVSEARARRPQPRLQRRRDRHAPALEELRHAGRMAERRRAAPIGGYKENRLRRAPTPRRTSSSRSSATTSRSPARRDWRRSRSSSATGSRTRSRRSTTANRRRASCCSRRSRTRTSAIPTCPTATRTTSGWRSTRKAMAEVAKAHKRDASSTCSRRARSCTRRRRRR